MAAACVAVGAPLVRGLIDSVDCHVHSLSEAGYTALAASGSPIATLLTVLMTLYIAFIGYRLMLGRGGLQMGDMTVSVIKLGLVVALATNWPLVETLVYDTLFKAPTEVGALLLEQLRGADVPADPFASLQAAFDALLKAAQHYTAQTHAPDGAPDGVLQGGAGFAAFATTVGGLLMLLTSLGVVLACKVVLSVLLALTPLIAGLLLFETTRGLVQGWLKAMIALAVLPMVAILGLALELAMLAPSLKALAALRDAQPGAPLDTAPAVTVLILSLVFATVQVLAAVAVSVIAAGLRLPRAAPAGTADDRIATTVAARYPSPEIEPRSHAAHVAAAVATLERRGTSPSASAPPSSPRRLSVVADRGPSTETSITPSPLGASYRRAAAPRRDALSARRDL